MRGPGARVRIRLKKKINFDPAGPRKVLGTRNSSRPGARYPPMSLAIAYLTTGARAYLPARGLAPA